MSLKEKSIPKNEILGTLRDIWKRRTKKSGKSLADLLGIHASNLSAYCSANGSRMAPDWCILYLLDELNCGLIIEPTKIIITSLSKDQKDEINVHF